MSELKKGAILSYITIFITNIVGLLLTPFIIKSLGDAEYGLYTLIGAFVGYIGILDFGLNNTIVRFVAKYRAENDKRGEENFLAISMIIYSVISLIIIAFGVVLYYNLHKVFGNSLTTIEFEKAKIMFAILIFNLAITLPGGAFTAISNGYERFVYPRTVNILRYFLRSALVVALLLWGGDAIGLVILDTIMNVLVIVIIGFYCFKKLKVTVQLTNFNYTLVKEIFSYSIWVFILVIISQFQWQSGQLILGILKDTTTVAIYAVGIMLGTYYGTFASAISSLLLPKATKMLYEGSSFEDINEMMIKLGRVTIFMLFFILGAFILFGQQFLNLWLGVNYSDSWLIALLIMIVITIPLSQSFANSILEASKKLRIKVLTAFFSMIVGVFLGILFAKSYDSFGMIIGILSGRILYEIILNIYYVKIIKLNMINFIKRVFVKNVIYFIIVLFFGVIINKIEGVGWLNFIIKSVLYTLVYLIVFYNLAMLNEEKSMIKTFIMINKNKKGNHEN